MIVFVILAVTIGLIGTIDAIRQTLKNKQNEDKKNNNRFD